MSTERFSYSGPAVIDGVTYPSVLLTENPLERGLRSWGGSVSFAQENAPKGFTPDLGSGAPVAVDLPDGRSGQVFVANVNFDGRDWTLELLGTGPTPE
jgi:hypothetical protein